MSRGWVVLEVGIGGTWDPTNVAGGVVSVVTPIGLDHTDMLGETLAEIATEKSGIIKPGGFLVSSVQEPEAADVLLASAREKEASFAFEEWSSAWSLASLRSAVSC